MKSLISVTVLCLVSVLTLFGCSGREETSLTTNVQEPITTVTDTPLGITWYPIWGFDPNPPFDPKPGLGTLGWNAITFDELRHDFVSERPADGFYSSADISTISRQLRQMDEIGVDVVFISWNGWGDIDLDGVVDTPNFPASNHDAVIKFLDHMKENYPHMKFVMMAEPFWFFFAGEIGTSIGKLDITSNQIQLMLDYTWDNLYGPNSPYGEMVFQWDGGEGPKPLFMAAEPWLPKYTGNDPRMVLRTADFGLFDTATPVLWPAPHYVPPPSPLYDEGVIMIWPRKDEWFMNMGRKGSRDVMRSDRVDPFLLEGVYDDAWKQIIEHERRKDINLIWLWSWNSWFDYVYIEPDSKTTMQSHGRTLFDKTGYYFDLFRSGQPFQQYQSPQETP